MNLKERYETKGFDITDSEFLVDYDLFLEGIQDNVCEFVLSDKTEMEILYQILEQVVVDVKDIIVSVYNPYGGVCETPFYSNSIWIRTDKPWWEIKELFVMVPHIEPMLFETLLMYEHERECFELEDSWWFQRDGEIVKFNQAMSFDDMKKIICLDWE